MEGTGEEDGNSGWRYKVETHSTDSNGATCVSLGQHTEKRVHCRLGWDGRGRQKISGPSFHPEAKAAYSTPEIFSVR